MGEEKKIDSAENKTSTVQKENIDKKAEQSKALVMEEVTELLDNDNILKAIKSFETDSDEKKIALEFVNSHIQFLNEIVENDYKKGIVRQNVEIQDLVSHVNMMLRNRDEYIFTTMIVHSPSHYRCVQAEMYKNPEERAAESVEQSKQE